MPAPIGSSERVLERQRLIMEQRIKGKSLNELHKWWNDTYPDQACSRAVIAKDIQFSVDRSIKEINLNATQWRQIHIDRAEKILSNEAFARKLESGDLFAIDRFIKLSDHIAKLTGAYMPTKITQTDITGEQNVAQLSDDERLKLIEDLFATVRERKALEDSTKIIDVDVVHSSEEV